MLNLLGGFVGFSGACDSRIYFDEDFEEDEDESIDVIDSLLGYTLGQAQPTYGETPAEPVRPEQIVEGRPYLDDVLEQQDTANLPFDEAAEFVAAMMRGIEPDRTKSE
jgi:hypothetical protein